MEVILPKEEPSLEHLNLSKEESINVDDRSVVIFGFNGAGKTTIYQYLKANNQNWFYMDYEGIKDDIAEQKRGKTLTITPRLSEIESKERDIQLQKDTVKDMMKRFNVNTTKKVKDFPETIKALQKAKTIKTDFFISEAKATRAFDIMDENKLDNFVTFYDKIQEINDARGEIDSYKDKLLHTALKSLDSYVDDGDTICPVCRQNSTDLKDRIRHTLESLEDLENLIAEKFENPTHNTGEKESHLNDIKMYAEDLSEEELVNLMYLIYKRDSETGFSSDYYDSCLTEYNHYNRDNKEYIQLLENREEEFQLLKESENDLSTMLSSKLDSFSNIDFNEAEHTMNINFERAPFNHSFGEKNFLTFLIRLYTYKASDQKLMILDDPISSFDLAYQYQIAFELAYLNDRTSKSFLILTHNPELINLLESFSPNNKFNYFSVDVNDDNERILLQISDLDASDNFLSLLSIMSFDNEGYIRAVIEREQNGNQDLHDIFHYKESSTRNYQKYNLSNDILVNKIENFDGSVFNEDFSFNTYYKILLLLALRVWAEKQVYDRIQNDNELLDKFKEKRTLHSVIIFAQNDLGMINADVRKKLMAKKVMLNKNAHFQSQIMPFYYAMNIPIKNICNEIEEIKEML